jgi:hypothetical protein
MPPPREVFRSDFGWSSAEGTPTSSRRTRGVTAGAPEFIRGRRALALRKKTRAQRMRFSAGPQQRRFRRERYERPPSIVNPTEALHRLRSPAKAIYKLTSFEISNLKSEIRLPESFAFCQLPVATDRSRPVSYRSLRCDRPVSTRIESVGRMDALFDARGRCEPQRGRGSLK